jgi:hypothetical protein
MRLDNRLFGTRTEVSNGTETDYILAPGEPPVELHAYWQERMRKRSRSPGYVSARSMANGSELWRAAGAIPGFGFGTRVGCVANFGSDRPPDVLVQCDLKADEPALLLSGKTGNELARIPHRLGFAGCLGDVDRDGFPDFYLDREDPNLIGRCNSVEIVSGKTGRHLFDLRYPDMWDEYEVTVPMGDLDGDGVPDIALGAPNFNLKGIEDHGHTVGLGQFLAFLNLPAAMSIESDPWCSFTWESGCAVVYSGRTREPIFGVWGEPGTREGVGLEVVALPDMNGDGHRDILVADENTAYIFAGPGPTK